MRAHAMSTAVILALLLLALAPADSAVADIMAARLAATGGKYEICISSWTPMVLCNATESQDTYGGYQVELFRRLATAVGWIKDDFYLRCMDWTPMLEDLTSDNGTCYMSSAGVDVTNENLKTGIRFSWPTYRSGLKVLIAAQTLSSGPWAMFNAFQWQVWVAVVLTGVAVGVVIYCIEKVAAWLKASSQQASSTGITSGAGMHKRSHTAGSLIAEGLNSARVSQAAAGGPSNDGALRHSATGAGHLAVEPSRASAGSLSGFVGGYETYGEEDAGPNKYSNRRPQPGLPQGHSQFSLALQLRELGNCCWHSVGKLVDMSQPKPLTMAGRLVLLAYGFLILILVNLYTANTAAVITTTRLNSQIASKSDLPGKAVGTWYPYLKQLRRYNIVASPLPWEHGADEKTMLETLRSGQVTALILDASFVDYQDSQNCDLHGIGSTFDTWNLAFAFPRNVNESAYITPWSAALINLQQSTSVLDQLEEEFVKISGPCLDNSRVLVDGLSFGQVAGLWIILGGTIAISLGLMLTGYLWRSYQLLQPLANRHAVWAEHRILPPGASAFEAADSELNHSSNGMDFGPRSNSGALGFGGGFGTTSHSGAGIGSRLGGGMGPGTRLSAKLEPDSSHMWPQRGSVSGRDHGMDSPGDARAQVVLGSAGTNGLGKWPQLDEPQQRQRPQQPHQQQQSQQQQQQQQPQQPQQPQHLQPAPVVRHSAQAGTDEGSDGEPQPQSPSMAAGRTSAKAYHYADSGADMPSTGTAAARSNTDGPGNLSSRDPAALAGQQLPPLASSPSQHRSRVSAAALTGAPSKKAPARSDLPGHSGTSQ